MPVPASEKGGDLSKIRSGSGAHFDVRAHTSFQLRRASAGLPMSHAPSSWRMEEGGGGCFSRPGVLFEIGFRV
jgi:hypothetical protein